MFCQENASRSAEDELLEKILKRLTKAAADNVLLEQMEKEELAQHEYDNALGEKGDGAC